MINDLKKTRFYIALSLIVQSVSYIALFIMLYSRKRSFATAFLAVGAIGGSIGSFILMLDKIEDGERFARIRNTKNAVIEDAADVYEEEIVVPLKREEIEIPVDETADETEFA